MRSSVFPILIAIAAAASALPADAGPRGNGAYIRIQAERAREEVVAQQGLLPLDVVLGNVARQIPGHHLDAAGPFPRGGRWIYRIKWLTPDGRVLIVIADAQSGQVLDVR